MNAYDLPETLTVAGREYAIRWDFRAVLDILIAMNDPNLDGPHKTMVMIQILYPDWKQIPQDDIDEAAKMACQFIDCGEKEDGKKKPKLIDWEQDASIIIPAVNSVAHMDVRSCRKLHWWTFWSYFVEIGESALSSVVSIRSKKSKGKKLEKWEQEYYRDNRDIIDFRTKETEEEKQVKEYLNKWL